MVIRYDPDDPAAVTVGPGRTCADFSAGPLLTAEMLFQAFQVGRKLARWGAGGQRSLS